MTNKELRELLAEASEPCGGFLRQCPNPTMHLLYFNLPYKQKKLMMLEREKRYIRDAEEKQQR